MDTKELARLMGFSRNHRIAPGEECAMNSIARAVGRVMGVR